MGGPDPAGVKPGRPHRGSLCGGPGGRPAAGCNGEGFFHPHHPPTPPQISATNLDCLQLNSNARCEPAREGNPFENRHPSSVFQSFRESDSGELTQLSPRCAAGKPAGKDPGEVHGAQSLCKVQGEGSGVSVENAA